MIRVSKLLLLLTAALLLSACGGDDSSSKDSKSSKSKEKKIDRTGYFTDKESKAINPPLLQWNTAVDAGIANNEKCNAESDRLYKQGKSGTVIVACHRKETRAVLAGIAAMQKAVAGLDGDYRSECDDAIKDVETALDKMEREWKTLDADWAAYANGKATPKVQQHSLATDTSRDNWRNTLFPAWTKACYTQADIDAETDRVAKDAKESEAKGDDATKDEDDSADEDDDKS